MAGMSVDNITGMACWSRADKQW